MNSNHQIDQLLVKLDLDDKAVVDDIIARLTTFLPTSVRMLATLQMHKAFGVPKLEVYQPREKNSEGKNNIWFAVQGDDMTYTEVSLGIYCQDIPEDIEKVTQILNVWLDWKKEQAFYSNPDYISQPIKSLCEKKGSIPMYITHHVMTLESLEDLPSLPAPPDNVQVKPLTIGNVDKVADNWGFTKVLGRRLVELNIGIAIGNGMAYGVFEDNDLAACMMIHTNGALSLLVTFPEYRRRGYARLLIDALSRKYFAVTNSSPYGYINVENLACQALGMGFKRTHKGDIFFYKPT